MDLPTELACPFCSWRPKDPTMFRFVTKPLCVSCGGQLVPTVPIEPEKPKRSSWERILDD